MKNGETFEGWRWSVSPYAFKGRKIGEAESVFMYGGLADGTYTVTEASAPFGSAGTAKTFKITLDYPNGETITAAKDLQDWGLIDPKEAVVYFTKTSKAIPLTGGRSGLIALTGAGAVLLFSFSFAAAGLKSKKSEKRQNL